MLKARIASEYFDLSGGISTLSDKLMGFRFDISYEDFI